MTGCVALGFVTLLLSLLALGFWTPLGALTAYLLAISLALVVSFAGHHFFERTEPKTVKRDGKGSKGRYS